jgi:YD repeat-containing protein
MIIAETLLNDIGRLRTQAGERIYCAIRRMIGCSVLYAIAGTNAHAADSCYQFQLQSPAYTTPWFPDPESACANYAHYCAGTPDSTHQSYCFIASFGSGPGQYSINYVTHSVWENGQTYPAGLWCSITTNATYHYVDGTTSTQDHGPANGSVPYRTNPAGCGVFVSALFSTSAQCGPTCNGVGHPINPASGAVYDTIADVVSSVDSLSFKRFYNSLDSGIPDLNAGWRHSFSRTITPKYQSMDYKPYVASPDNSSLYDDEATACTSGFAQIKSRVSTWASATASYLNGVCTLKAGSTLIGTLDLFYSAPSTLSPWMRVVSFDATRDDGQLIGFMVNGSSIVAPPTINLKLQQTSGGYTLTDANDNIETYDTNGKLFSITSRAGVVQTMSYDASGRLSSVTDSFGHHLSLSYDSQNRLIGVTRQ